MAQLLEDANLPEEVSEEELRARRKSKPASSSSGKKRGEKRRHEKAASQGEKKNASAAPVSPRAALERKEKEQLVASAPIASPPAVKSGGIFNFLWGSKKVLQYSLLRCS